MVSKVAIERFADEGIECLKFVGTIDETFDGKQTGSAVKADTLVLDLGGVVKISSFGIREWVDFTTTAGKHARQILLIECTPKVIDQLNMVANFAGRGRVYSFYAPFRCDFCDSEHRVLLDISKDFEALKAMKLAERPCPVCKESMYFDEDGATFFSYVLGQGAFELEPAVSAFLAAKLDYRVGAVDTKLKVDKVIAGRITYLRLAGALDATFPRDKLADGLEGTVIVDLGGVARVEPAGAAEWRSFVQQISPLVETLLLAGIQPAVLEKLCRPEDLGTKAQVIDIALPYACTSCSHTGAQVIDTATHRAVLKFATAPELPCAACKATMHTTATEAQMLVLPGLPVPTLAKDVQHTLGELRLRRIERRSSPGLGPTPVRATELRKRGAGVMIALVLLVLVAVGAVGYIAYGQLATHDRGPFGLGPVVARSRGTARPVWIEPTDGPGSVRCAPSSDGALTCIGVSQLLASQADAEDEASDAAYEGIAFELAKDPVLAKLVSPDARAAAFAAAARDPRSTQAKRDLHEGRHAAARVIVPAVGPIAARYWEAYATGEGRTFVAFAQVTMSKAARAAWPDKAKVRATALGTTVVSYQPELGWRFPKLDHGAIVTALDQSPLQGLGLAEHYVVLAVDGHDVVDAEHFASYLTSEYASLEDTGGTLRILVQTESGDPREFSKTILANPLPVEVHPLGGAHPLPDPSTGVNVWDRFGGK